MNRFCNVFAATLIPSLLLLLSACASPASPTPSPTAAPSKAEAPAAPKSSESTPAAKATSSPMPAATPVPKPTATPTAGVASVSELVAKAKATTEYSFDIKVNAAGQTMTGKSYVKGMKMRQEMSVAGQNTVLLLNLAEKVAYMLMPDQNIAVKTDFNEASSQTDLPNERISDLPSGAKLIGTDTIDGKLAAVFEVPGSQGTGKYWVWIERGLPLKLEVVTAEGKTVMEYSNYKFGGLADSLFELPAGVQVMDLPVNLPGVPGSNP